MYVAKKKAQNVISEISPTSLNQETREASNMCHGLCKSSRNRSHFDRLICDTTGVLF